MKNMTKNQKKALIFTLVFIGVIVLGIFLFIKIGFFSDRTEFLSNEEVLKESKEKMPIGDIKVLNDYYVRYEHEKNEITGEYEENEVISDKPDNKWEWEHRFEVEETNSRGLKFIIKDVSDFDGLFTSKTFYYLDTDFHYVALLDYISKHPLPDSDYYKDSRMRVGIEIIVPYYSDSDFETKLDHINDYVIKVNNYNKKITGTDNNLKIYVRFEDTTNYLGSSNDFYIYIHNKKLDEECSYKKIKKCAKKKKKFYDEKIKNS